jgi:hypothetical protein
MGIGIRAIGALVGVAVVLVCGDGFSESGPRPDAGSRSLDTSDYVWADSGRPRRPVEPDLKTCLKQVSRDPWFGAQTQVNRSILVIGCMNKRGWSYLGTQGRSSLISARPSPFTRDFFAGCL